MKVLQRYFLNEIVRSVLFALAAFLALFAFFDLMNELQAVGRGGYKLQHAFGFVLLGLPSYAYELMPIAVLIGTIYTLAQFAAHSEFTIMRVSSMSTRMSAMMLFKIGALFVVATVLIGEFVAPKSAEFAEKLKLGAKGASLSQEFKSGLWSKDVIKKDGLTGEVTGSRFINIHDILPNGELHGVKVYEFDQNFHLTAIILADHSIYAGAHVWRLSNVVQTDFVNGGSTDINTAIATKNMPVKDMVSEITPGILAVLFADPDRMSAFDLKAYIKHLAENSQHTERYEIAFWKKVIYPLSIFVMMALALPFAYLHFRAGGVSLKIFTGIMIGLSFQLVNSLFSHLGLLNTWPPLITAAVPSVLFMVVAIGALSRVERH
ncbi:LPS export ABC transporter permease LptG [Glaciimonas immobilis]|uniref:Lipopolysaccharide export system permease protein n=1 Tax=Glaciimonas immobilis TaxID=728004 RepID=A0A840RTU0_9BURK|nr:LPS export ABC transporter permease LptG [Glaciimonas immobilis]KAF3997706.1 LPS export ABC transporter permease LptG [Glaciimonas immobilis]MBB5200572.1 lipopolysaccharide export system permease protein [Glaciimonas immobilis]